MGCSDLADVRVVAHFRAVCPRLQRRRRLSSLVQSCNGFGCGWLCAVHGWAPPVFFTRAFFSRRLSASARSARPPWYQTTTILCSQGETNAAAHNQFRQRIYLIYYHQIWWGLRFVFHTCNNTFPAALNPSQSQTIHIHRPSPMQCPFPSKTTPIQMGSHQCRVLGLSSTCPSQDTFQVSDGSWKIPDGRFTRRREHHRRHPTKDFLKTFSWRRDHQQETFTDDQHVEVNGWPRSGG
ncbi:hypothetical protein BJ166DRAFT_157181 [Pestalotiopsis sp. NC0098]|nr:hypothetical protein BJ166DRAFT_157181 [Pestalotiopsis sp. NC0098]